MESTGMRLKRHVRNVEDWRGFNCADVKENVEEDVSPTWLSGGEIGSKGTKKKGKKKEMKAKLKQNTEEPGGANTGKGLLSSFQKALGRDGMILSVILCTLYFFF